MTDPIPVLSYSEAREEGTVRDKDGYHQPGTNRYHVGCGCSLDTDKGAYRDVTVETPDGLVLYFYHQSPVVVQLGGRYRLDSHGYRTSTTKQRINRHTPRGVKVFQEDYEWYLKQYDPSVSLSERDPTIEEFTDGMHINPE